MKNALKIQFYHWLNKYKIKLVDSLIFRTLNLLYSNQVDILLNNIYSSNAPKSISPLPPVLVPLTRYL